MSFTSSKKKIKLSDDFLDAEPNFSLDGLMKMVNENCSVRIIKTPSKNYQNCHNNRRIAQMKWNDLSTAKHKRIIDSSFSQIFKKRPNISVLKNKIQVKKRQISKQAQENNKLIQTIQKKNKFIIGILQGQKSIQELKQLAAIEQQNLKEIRENISKSEKEQQEREQRIQKLESNKQILQHKLKMCQQTKHNLEQRKRNIVYAMEAQMKKNNQLKNKLQEQKNLYSKSKIIQKLANQLFTILILHNQIKNCKEINKRQNINIPKANNKKKGNKQINQMQVNNVKESSMENQLKLCLKEFNTSQQSKKAQDRRSICVQFSNQKFQKQQKYEKCQERENNKEMLHRLPFQLVVISSTYIYLKLKDVDRKYFNKISYFCDKIKTIFELDRFVQIVEDYFAQRKNPKSRQQTMHMVKLQVDRNTKDVKCQQTKQQEITFDGHVETKGQQSKNNKEGQIRVIMKVSTNCVCGYQLSESLKNGNLQNLMKKHLKMRITSIQPTEECCSIMQIQERLKYE